MRKLLLAIMGIFSIFSASCSKKSEQGDVANELHARFRVGQVWAFKAPPHLPDARLTILRVESDGRGDVIVHVALSGVSYGDGQTKVNHLPFAATAVDESVTTLERESGETPDFQEGYDTWRVAYDAGKAGVFTISVGEAYEQVTGVLDGSK
jgi:hypothetical protein